MTTQDHRHHAITPAVRIATNQPSAGMVHLSNGDGTTLCGRPIPDGAEPVDAAVTCCNCARRRWSR